MKLPLIPVGLVAFCLALPVHPQDAYVLPPFSTAPLGNERVPGWQPVYISGVKKRTELMIEDDAGQRVLKIRANASAGSMVTALNANPLAFPLLRWRWKLPAHNAKTNLLTKKGDDYPARVYVMFDYDTAKLGFLDRAKLRLARKLYGEQVPAAALCYVWDAKHPAGTTAWNAYTNRVRMIVVRGGDEKLGQWVEEERNIAQDFKAAFGEDPPKLSAIAVGGDSDNTDESTLSFLGDLTLSAH
ncbi:MAG: DUF3047 domain-containing protein [Burkholderiales bacterium]